MRIKYYLIDNPMTDDPNDCRAQVTGYEAVTENEIIDYMTRKGSGITTAEARANYTEIIEAHEFFLKQGYGVNTEFINARPTIQGVFKDKDDMFDSSRHLIKFKVRFGKRYNQTAKDVKNEKVEPVSNVPVLSNFEDVASATINDTLTPGGVATLTGARLKFDQADTNQGIFFIASDKTVTRVSKILSHTNSKVVFMTPTGIAAGDYALEIRILPHGNKDVKKGSLEDKLVV